MRGILLSLARAILGTGPVSAQGAEADAAIQGVIGSQMQAFRDGDIPQAWSHASPMIKGLFGSENNFARMVQNGYPMVWDPSKTKFLDAIPRGDMIVQRLQIIDQKGRAYIAEYAMLMVDGEWRIAGVEIKEDKSFGV